jgi:hypothetical protein
MSALKQRVQGKADVLQVVVERVTKCVLYQKKNERWTKNERLEKGCTRSH